MISIFKNHPFAVEAYFVSSTVLTFAVPKQQLLAMIPECLSLDTYDDHWAFIAVALVDTKGLRPKGFPAIFGNSFFLIGYRIFVQYYTTSGKRLRGLYVIKSETDKRKMQFLGNIFTSYNYNFIDITLNHTENRTKINSISGLAIEIDHLSSDVELPLCSPFKNLSEARKFSGPLPYTFAYDVKKKAVIIVEGVRKGWQPVPVRVVDYRIPFLKELNFEGLVLANAFHIKGISYCWKKGKSELWDS